LNFAHTAHFVWFSKLKATISLNIIMRPVFAMEILGVFRAAGTKYCLDSFRLQGVRFLLISHGIVFL
jgi:hypothetical protein